jgi:hypothetical protein
MMSSPSPLYALVLMVSALYSSIIVHELGHALAGTLAGFRIVSCGIGITRPFAQIRIAGIWFYLARPFLRGITLAIPSRLGPNRKATALLYSGGSLANLLAVLVIWVVWHPLADWTSWRPFDHWTFPRVFMDASLMMGIGNLLPFYSSRYGTASDGLTIVRCILNTRSFDHANSITSYEWVFNFFKSLNAREGVAYYGRALALECVSMGDFQTAEELLEDPTLPAAEPNSLVYQVDFLARVTIAVGKKAPNAEALIAEATHVCTDEDASLSLKLLLAEHRMNAGENPRPLVEEVLSIARDTKRHALATEAEALLLLIAPAEELLRGHKRLLDRSGAYRLQSTTALRLLVSVAKYVSTQGSLEYAKKMVERGRLLLTSAAQLITNVSIRERVIEAGMTKLRTALPIEE